MMIEQARKEQTTKFYERYPEYDKRMGSVIRDMRLKCGIKCPRCGAELCHFTLRGFPICSNSDCMYLVLPTQNRRGISKAQRRQIEREDAEALLEELDDEE